MDPGPFNNVVGKFGDSVDSFLNTVDQKYGKIALKYGRIMFITLFPIFIPIIIVLLSILFIIIYPVGCICIIETSYYERYCSSCKKLFRHKLKKELCKDCLGIKDIIE
jgi:hypothetical protein